MRVKSKNIHVLPTDKPSLLHKAFDNTFILSTTPTMQSKLYKSQPYHISITSDEEIKDGDFFISLEGKLLQFTGRNVLGDKFKAPKVILTTDPDLIKDGVWGIEDGFLEWFVKNPACEYVELKGYAIILPEESCDCDKICNECEPKQEKDYSALLQPVGTKQETLEEVAEKYSAYSLAKVGFIEGAKWQQEQIYNQIKELYDNENITGFSKRAYAQCLDIIEQFKNK